MAVAALAATMAMTLSDVPVRRAEAAPKPKPAEVLERPDEMAALITARMTGQDVRVTGMTTESAEYIAHPNGQIKATVHAGPVRMRQNQKWVPIDLRLQPAADGSVQAVAHPLDLRISGKRSGAGELAAVGVGDGRFALGWPGALPTPVLDQNRATYPEIAPGIDLVVEATRTGFSQFLTVKSRDAVDRLPSLALPLTGKGLASFTQDSAGGLTLLNAKGKPLATVPAPQMWDARRAPGSEEPTRRTMVRTKAERPAAANRGAAANGLTMRLQPDLTWLKDPATQYPVTIDPQVNPLYTSFDTYVKEGDTVDRGGANDLQLGLLAGSPNVKSRAFVHWPVSALAGKQITSATVYFWNFWSNTCTANSWEIWSTGAASSATRWGTQPTWIQKEATSTQTKGFSSACDDGWVNISGTSFFQRAATAGQSTAYMGVRGTDETNTNSFKQFRSRNAADSSQVPYAVVTYNSYPTVGTRSTVPSTACVTGTARPTVNTATPQLKSVISDGEGSTVKAEIEWWTLTGTTKLGSTITGTAASGSTFTASVPAGVMVNGSSYKWRVRGNDGSVDGAWSPFCEFTVDTSIGAPPIVSSTTYPENQWGGDANVAANFTFDPNGIADAAAYEYSLDVSPPNKVVNAPAPGAPATVSIKPLTPGWHNIWARTRDSAGNVTALRSYPFKVGSGSQDSPRAGDVSGAKVALASTAAPSFADVTYQWRRAGSDSWVTIPAGHVTYAVGGGAVTWPVALASGIAPRLNWDVSATLASVDAAGIPRDGPVQVRPFFNLSNYGAPADLVKFRFDRNLASADTAQVGPGSVNLITGNYQLSASDVSVAGLSISRTVNSRQPLGLDPLFGPGWVSGLVVSDADAPYTKLTAYGSLVQVRLPDDSSIGFTKVDSAGVNYEPQVGAESYSLTFASATSTFTLSDDKGNVVKFTRTATDPANVYTPTSVTPPGSGNTTTYSWEKVTLGTNDIMRPTRLLAPVPAGVSCTTLVRGCRALTFTYATTTTATGLGDGQWGDYVGRVKQISYTAWDPDLATPAMRTVVLARYTYDNGGRLRSFADPRLDYTDGTGAHSLRTVYFYDSNGIIVSLTPPAQQPWQFSYTTTPSDPGKGRLYKVTRSALTAGTAVETVVYQVPTSGSGAPYDLSGAQTARWAQSEPPTDATAVFPATQVPTGDPSTGTLPGSYERATVTYLDANARTVNSAQPGGYLTTTWYDGYGNTVGDLSAGNRKRALDASTTDNATAEAQVAAKLRETSVYSGDGQRLLETFGPEHDVMLSTGTVVRGRTHARYTYDEGAPGTGGPYNLGTTERVSVSYIDGGQTVDADTRTSTTRYDWTLKQPTVQIVDPDGLDLTTRTAYDARGAVVSQTSPGGGDSTTTPSTRQTVYYTTAANATYPECGGHAEWAGAVCRTSAGGQPEQGQQLLSRVTTYDFYGQQRTVTEQNSSGAQRTTTFAYDAAGRQSEATVTGPVSSGEPIEKRRNVYDQATAQLSRTETLNGSGVVTAQVVRGYDALGRSISYTDADGNVSTTTYDIASRPSVINDGKGTRTLTYDGGAERRGLPTQLADSQSGNFVGSYDADGVLATQNSPNGLVTSVQVNEAALITNLSYVKPGCGQSDCTVYAETLSYSGGEERRVSTSTLSGQAYTYDAAGRVTKVQDTLSGQCTTRAYGFDQATNRVDLNTFGAGTGGACQAATTLTSQTWDHDSADRLVGTGYTYDALGRTLMQPATDSAVPGGGTAQFTYYVNDMARTAVQGSRQATYTLDVLSNRFRSWTDTATGLVKRHHYSNEGDKPAWTDEGNGNSTRQVAGLAGVAGTFANTTGVTWTIVNVNGDNVAGMTETGTGLAYTSGYTEYGLARNSADAGSRRYGWQGSAQRAADTPGGVVLMGARIYNPATGRFLSNDPVYGGNANSYEYSTGDPVNKHDHSGALSCWRYNKYWSNWYYWWGQYGGRRYSTDFSCYLSHRDFAWLGTYGLAYGLIASGLTGWFAAAYAIAAFILAVMYLHYDHWCRGKGATYKGRLRIYYDRNWRNHHFSASYRGWYCN
ncbi:RHS repeat-associated core domain-containing protein [Micromonospora chalcea]|uniref:RHS repeat-associated core domain-containing protein n=1 Tax=Micromonospora sp. TSRI0369 TaxID=1703936 RepID=UPI000A55252F|nr:RHS repeat-associated core domain-containing protein [Micromonospora sp. TSRI0369]